MTKTILICTVGGSHKPIVKAIESTKPHLVCFVCSDDDLSTGNKGSYTQISGKGLCIKENHDELKPSLPNIPSQVGLPEDQFEIILVRPDDLSHVCEQIQAWLKQQESESTQFIADYTGGTKTMTAGLVTVALQDERVQLQLITGPRSDLRQVRANHGSSTRARVENLRIQQQLEGALELWKHHGYAEAAQLTKRIINPQEAILSARLEQVRSASQALADWDCFQHQQALDHLQDYRRIFAEPWTDFYNLLGKLTSADEGTRELFQLFDLWRNAQRRATAGRFDDAVSRWYRLVEGSAQWILQHKVGIDTANVPADKIPPELNLTSDKEGNYKVASTNAWKLVSIYGPEQAQKFWRQEEERLRDYQNRRNHSILAHGFRPISQEDWSLLSDWTDGQLIPLLFSFAQEQPNRMKALPSQLPREFPL